MSNVRVALGLRTGVRDGSKRAVDLGSGDGRLVIEAAKLGFKADGVELNPWLNAFATVNSWREGVGKMCNFKTTDLWKVDYGEYDDIVVFGVGEMMDELHSTIASAQHKDSRLIVCRFAIPGLVPAHIIGDGIDSVWIYHPDAERVKGFLPKGAPRIPGH